MTLRVAIPRPKRWDKPFDPDMSQQDVERVLFLDIFRAIDPNPFPKSLSLSDIIRNDARVQRYRRGDIIVRKGDYGNAVFVVISGSVRAVLDSGKRRDLQEDNPVLKRGFFQALGQLWSNAKVPEMRDITTYRAGEEAEEEIGIRRDQRNRTRSVVRNIDALITNHPTRLLGAQEMFGEVAALSRAPHVATVFADSDAVVLELRWQGLRDIRRRDKAFRDKIDALYRASSLKAHLRESTLFRHLDKETLELIAAQTLFETHGDFEWVSGFKEVAAEDPNDVIESEPVVAEHGDYLDGLLLVRSGFGRVTERRDRGHHTIGYVTHNEVFGLPEILDHWRAGNELRLRYGLRAVGFVDLLRVPTTLVEKYVLPGLPTDRLLATAGVASAGGGATGKKGAVDGHNGHGEQEVRVGGLDFLVNTRTINGTSAMFINTDRCTACDECVRACAATHDNNPRFVRHGPEDDRTMVANACMHCVDAVCLIGCPTGAIHRNPGDGVVVIDDTTCIGCATCAQSCPYDNIRMVEIRDASGAFIVDDETQMPIVKATKCDLCIGQLGGPACQRACPHDALVRLDMRDRERLADWLGR